MMVNFGRATLGLSMVILLAMSSPGLAMNAIQAPNLLSQMGIAPTNWAQQQLQQQQAALLQQQAQLQAIKNQILQRELNEEAQVSQRPLPTSDDQQANECAWLRAEYQRENGVAGQIGLLAVDQQDANLWALLVQRNQTALQARFTQVRCT